MNADGVWRIAERLGVPDGAISLGGPGVGECYVVERDGDAWSVYYAERGMRRQEQRFASESAAYRYLIGWLVDSVLRWGRI